MALFGIGKKNKEEKSAPRKKGEAKAEPVSKAEHRVSATSGLAPVLLGQRVTEKASMLQQNRNVYTFNVEGDATKNAIADSVARLYKVHPTKVRIVRVPSKRVFVRGKRGVKRGGYKAYVFLKEGEKIEIS